MDDGGNIRRISVAAEVADAVIRSIQENGWVPGTRLGRREDLAQQYGVSPGTLHAALRLVEAQGLIQSKPGSHGGVFVAEPSAQIRLASVFLTLLEGRDEQNIKETYFTRLWLDVLLSRMAALNRDTEDVAEMYACLHSMMTAKNQKIYLEMDWNLHVIIAGAAKNPLLINVYTVLHDTLLQSVMDVVPVIGNNARSDSRLIHEGLVKAIDDQNAELAQQMAVWHVNRLIRKPNKPSDPKISS